MACIVDTDPMQKGFTGSRIVTGKPGVSAAPSGGPARHPARSPASPTRASGIRATRAMRSRGFCTTTPRGSRHPRGRRRRPRVVRRMGAGEPGQSVGRGRGRDGLRQTDEPGLAPSARPLDRARRDPAYRGDGARRRVGRPGSSPLRLRPVSSIDFEHGQYFMNEQGSSHGNR